MDKVDVLVNYIASLVNVTGARPYEEAQWRGDVRATVAAIIGVEDGRGDVGPEGDQEHDAGPVLEGTPASVGDDVLYTKGVYRRAPTKITIIDPQTQQVWIAQIDEPVDVKHLSLDADGYEYRLEWRNGVLTYWWIPF